MSSPAQPPTPPARARRKIPEATVARLPLYLRSLHEHQHAGVTTISSERLAELAAVNAAKLRKDLSYLVSYGTRGVGYDVEHLLRSEEHKSELQSLIRISFAVFFFKKTIQVTI